MALVAPMAPLHHCTPSRRTAHHVGTTLSGWTFFYFCAEEPAIRASRTCATQATRNLPLTFESMQLIGEGGGKGEPGGVLPSGRAANLVKVLSILDGCILCAPSSVAGDLCIIHITNSIILMLC